MISIFAAEPGMLEIWAFGSGSKTESRKENWLIYSSIKNVPFLEVDCLAPSPPTHLIVKVVYEVKNDFWFRIKLYIAL